MAKDEKFIEKKVKVKFNSSTSYPAFTVADKTKDANKLEEMKERDIKQYAETLQVSRLPMIGVTAGTVADVPEWWYLENKERVVKIPFEDEYKRTAEGNMPFEIEKTDDYQRGIRKSGEFMKEVALLELVDVSTAE
jgi:hypothetical protein